MTSTSDKPAAFATIATKLGKIVPMLGSDKTGDVVAAATAIVRLLGSAGLDLHDLAQRAAAPTLEDVMSTVVRARPAPPTTPPSTASTEPVKPAGFSDREWERALRRARGEEPPKREPAPWPTWGVLSHFGRLGMFDTIATAATFTAAEAESFGVARADYYRHQIPPSRKVVNLFNRASRDLWNSGWRPETETDTGRSRRAAA